MKKTKSKTKSKTKIKRAAILLADDISPEPEHATRSSAVRTCAAKLARRLECGVDVVHVEDISFYPIRSSYYKPLLQQYFAGQKAQLSELAKSVEVPARAMFLNGDPVRKILELGSKRGAYEAILLGTHGRKGLGRLVLGSVAEEIIRSAMVPVITVGPKAQDQEARFLARTGPDTPPRMLIATGLTPNSRRAEEYGLSLAKRLGAEVILFHGMRDALHPVLQTASATPGGAYELGKLLDQIQADSLKRLKAKAATFNKSGVKTTFTLDDKSMTSSGGILQEIDKSAVDLVVLGTHGRSLVAGAFFGRTARGVILESPVPVITVRSHGK